MSNYDYNNYNKYCSYYYSMIQNYMTDFHAYECLSHIHPNYQSLPQTANSTYKSLLIRILPETLADPFRSHKFMEYFNQFANYYNNVHCTPPTIQQKTRMVSNNYPNMYNNANQPPSLGVAERVLSIPTIENNQRINAVRIQNSRQMSNNVNINLSVPTLAPPRNQNNVNQPPPINSNIPQMKTISHPEILRVQMAQPKLFFYNELNVLTHWVRNSRIIYKVDSSTKKTFACLQYVFTSLIPLNILQIFTSKSGNTNYDILLRSIDIKTGQIQKKDSYPLDMDLYINGANYNSLLPRVEAKYTNQDLGQRLQYPTVLTNAIYNIIKDKPQHNPMVLNFSIVYPLNVDRKLKSMIFNGNYCFKVGLYYRKPLEEVVNNIVERPMLPSSKFYENIRSELSRDNDVSLESMIISLQSSVTLSAIKYPFRGKNCKHLIPDDLESYLAQNMGNEKFQCKICKNLCHPDDIFIDEYYYNILKNNPKISKIEIFLNGSFKVLESNDSDDEFDDDKEIARRGPNVPELIVLDSSGESDSDMDIVQTTPPSSYNRNLTEESVDRQQTTNIPVCEQESLNESTVRQVNEPIRVSDATLSNEVISNVNDNNTRSSNESQNTNNIPSSNEAVSGVNNDNTVNLLHEPESTSNIPLSDVTASEINENTSLPLHQSQNVNNIPSSNKAVSKKSVNTIESVSTVIDNIVESLHEQENVNIISSSNKGVSNKNDGNSELLNEPGINDIPSSEVEVLEISDDDTLPNESISKETSSVIKPSVNSIPLLNESISKETSNIIEPSINSIPLQNEAVSSTNDNTIRSLNEPENVNNTLSSNEASSEANVTTIEPVPEPQSINNSLPSNKGIQAIEYLNEKNSSTAGTTNNDNPMEVEVPVNVNETIVDNVTKNYSANETVLVNDSHQNNEIPKKPEFEIGDLSFSDDEYSSDSSISLNMDNFNESRRLKQNYQNFFTKTKEYVALKKAQFKYDPHPGDIFF